MNQTRKDFITKKFVERFWERHMYENFKNKYDVIRKVFTKFKSLTQNMTDLVI